MKKNSYYFLLIGLLFIVCFMTPIRDGIDSYRITHNSIFSDGFIDYSRLFLYAIIWALFSCVIGEKNDFEFLKQDRITLFFSRFVSRVIDSAILAILVSISMLIFSIITKSAILTYYIFMPVICFVYWLIYFTFSFGKYRTLGDKMLKIETKTDSGKTPYFMEIAIRELIYSLPLFLYALSVGILNYIDESGNDGFKERYIEYTFVFIPILIVVYILFPLSSVLNKNGTGLIDKWTKLRVNRINRI